jgi:hypothetical protein
MQNFKQYISEGTKGLTIFDIDDTMFKTKAKVEVKKDGKVVKVLSPKQFNTYKLGRGEDYDFGQFKSAKLFKQTAVPIGKMIQKFKAILKNAVKKGSDVVLVTARADMDDKELFLSTFRSHGINIDQSHIYRAGNIGGSSAAAKQKVFKKFLDTGDYKRVRLFDDDDSNLKALLSLKPDYNDIDFEAWKANDKGRIKKVS